MPFLFWFFFIIACIFAISSWGFWNFVGTILLLFILCLALMLFQAEFTENPKFRKKVLKGLGVLILLGAIGYTTWHVVCNVIYNRYELDLYLSMTFPTENDTTSITRFEKDYEIYFLAKNDSCAIEKTRRLAMKRARKWFVTSPMPYRIYVGRRLLQMSSYDHISISDESRDNLHNEICDTLHIVECIECLEGRQKEEHIHYRKRNKEPIITLNYEPTSKQAVSSKTSSN